MNEIIITTGKAMHTAGKALDIWRWEVPVYLFLGGITAGILIFAAYMIIKNKGEDYPVSTYRIMVGAPIAISLGMVFLFLDLSHKLYVWRFYTSFQVTSPMSWGAWILLLVYPFSIFLVLGTFRKGFPEIYKWIITKVTESKLGAHVSKLEWVFDFTEKYRVLVAKMTIPIGVILGIYTGILLNSLVARPFWNSAIMGPLFLVSGASTGAAIIILFSKNHKEREFFSKIDLGLIGLELVLIVLFILGMVTSTAVSQNAIKLILGGPLTAVFWSIVVVMGLSVPAILEILELKGKEIPVYISAGLVLVGGLALRFIITEAGQISSWLPY